MASEKTMIRLVFITSLALAAALDDPILSHEVRRLFDGDGFCPFDNAKEEKLLYNIDIAVEGVGEGCGDDDLLNIGEILQRIVEEVESNIPKYNNEYMQTTICKAPLVEGHLRGLRESLDESNRKLQTRSNGRYRYRGGGICRRCLRNNSDRRFLLEATTAEAACQMANMAIDGADLAATAVEKAGDAFSNLKETAFECSNLRAGKTLVTWAESALRECTAAQQEAQYAAQTARTQCEQATAASSETQFEPLARQAAEAFNTTMNAVDKVQKLHSEMQDKLETTDVCSLPIEPSGDTLSVGGASSMAEMATFGATMSEIAFQKSKEAYIQLRERALRCRDSTAGKQSIVSARAQLRASRKAKSDAAEEAKISRLHAQQAKAATSQEEFIQEAKLAEESSTAAFLAAWRARYSYSLIKDALERPICGNANSPDNGSIPEQSTPVPNTGTTTERGPPVPNISPNTSPTGSPMAENEVAAETPLKQWLLLFVNALYDKTAESILREYHDSKTCNLERLNVGIRIDALERQGEEQRLITEEDCGNLSKLTV